MSDDAVSFTLESVRQKWGQSVVNVVVVLTDDLDTLPCKLKVMEYLHNDPGYRLGMYVPTTGHTIDVALGKIEAALEDVAMVVICGSIEQISSTLETLETEWFIEREDVREEVRKAENENDGMCCLPVRKSICR